MRVGLCVSVCVCVCCCRFRVARCVVVVFLFEGVPPGALSTWWPRTVSVVRRLTPDWLVANSSTSHDDVHTTTHAPFLLVPLQTQARAVAQEREQQRRSCTHTHAQTLKVVFNTGKAPAHTALLRRLQRCSRQHPHRCPGPTAHC